MNKSQDDDDDDEDTLGQDADHAFEKLTLALVPHELNGLDRQRLRTRITTQACRHPPHGTTTLRLEEGRWEVLAPGVRMKVLRADETAGNRTILIRMGPGSRLDAHPHGQEEECFVIDGEILIGNHRLTPGDMHIASVGSVHQRILSPTGALLLVRAELFPAD